MPEETAPTPEVDAIMPLPLLMNPYPQIYAGALFDDVPNKYEIIAHLLVDDGILEHMARLTHLWPDQTSLFDALRLHASIMERRCSYTEFVETDRALYEITIIFGTNNYRPVLRINPLPEVEEAEHDSAEQAGANVPADSADEN